MTTSQTPLFNDHPKPLNTARSGHDLFARIAAGAGIASILLVILFAVQAFHQTYGSLPFWEYLALTMVFAALTVLSWLFGSGQQQEASGRALRMAVAVQFSMVVIALLIEGTGIPAALISLVFTLMIGFLSLSFERSGSIVMVGIFSAIAAYFFSSFSPIAQVSLPMMQVNLVALVGLLLMVYMTMLAMGFVVATLSVKLISSALAISLIPLLIFSAVQTGVTRTALLNESTGSLRLAADQAAIKVGGFLDQNIHSITLNSIYPSYLLFLQVPPEERQDSPQLNAIFSSIESLRSSSSASYLDSIAILDKNGINVYDTRPGMSGQSEKNMEYFAVPMSDAYKEQNGFVSPVFFSQGGVAYIVFSDAVYNEKREPIGVLRVRYNAAVLQSMIQGSSELLGAASYPLLVDENGVRLGDGSKRNLVYQPITPLSDMKLNDLFIKQRLPPKFEENPEAAIPDLMQAINSNDEVPFFTFQPGGDPDSVTHAGIVIRMQYVPWNLVYIQRMSAFSTMIQQQTKSTTLLITLLALIVSLAAALLSSMFSGRIMKLATTAEQITAGNLNVTAEVQEGDEIGMLGRAFNLMIKQLHTLIDELEARVEARTLELSQQNEALQMRSQQLKTVSDVARSIASTNDLETLLNQVALLVSHRFGFYHVGIFLIDEKKEYAYLRAANSEGGRKMLERQHKLKIGAVGIVGYACGEGEPRIATDVGQDATFFDNPDLPYTRSEMALPLKNGSDIIGALDVQSVESNAFSEEDIELFSILADQVAIAIVNNRLYAETSETLEEIQSLHSWYLQNEWKRETENRRHLSYRYNAQGVAPVDEVMDVEPAGGEEDALAVPIVLRGETIGAIRLQDQGEQEREWSQAEIGSVKAVADQIALALENARLFEQTARRAERERKVLEITSKIRSTNDFQTMMRVAVEELQQALGASRAQVILQGLEQNASKDAHNHNNNGHR